MDLTVVIDGGGTGCRLAALDKSGVQIAQVHSTSANLSLGADQVCNSIKSGMSLLAAELNKPEDWVPDTLWCGLAGSQQSEQKALFLEKMPPGTLCNIINDGHAQLLGCAQGTTPVACLSIGTGSVLNYLDDEANHSMQGGWGFPVGDEGSGAWLGMRAVHKLTQWYDTRFGTSKAPPLIEALFEVIEPSVEGILRYSTCKSPKELARLAPIVFDTAPLDKSANDIITNGTLHFQNLIAETANDVTIYIAGGLAKSYQPYLEALIKKDIFLAPQDAAIQGLHRYALQSQAATS